MDLTSDFRKNDSDSSSVFEGYLKGRLALHFHLGIRTHYLNETTNYICANFQRAVIYQPVEELNIPLKLHPREVFPYCENRNQYLVFVLVGDLDKTFQGAPLWMNCGSFPRL